MYKKGEKFFKRGLPADRIINVIGEEGLKNVGLENNLYQIAVDGFSSDDIEEIFIEYGEKYYNDIIAEIETLNSNQKISQSINDKLCLFMAAMKVRTPQFKRESDEMSSTFQKHRMTIKMQNTSPEELQEQYKEISGGEEATVEEMEKLRQTFIKKEYDLKYPNAHFLRFALSTLEMYADVFHSMNMVILKSRSDRYFITSDNPVVHFVPKDKVDFYNNYKSLMSHHTEVFFTLSKNLAVFLTRKDFKEVLQDADREITDTINYNISVNSFDFIFSPLEMNSLNAFSEKYIPYPFKFRIS